MVLKQLEMEFSVCKLDSLDGVDMAKEYTFAASTSDAISLVCQSRFAPVSVKREDGWRALRVEGTMEFGLVGVIAGISSVLAAAEIPVFVISTFDTDYILVKRERFAQAAQSLRKAGYTVV